MVEFSRSQMYSMLKANVATFRHITIVFSSKAFVDTIAFHHISTFIVDVWNIHLLRGDFIFFLVLVTFNLTPNSESVGFQSLEPGVGDTKMHGPKNRNSPGNLLEPFAVGLQSCINSNPALPRSHVH